LGCSWCCEEGPAVNEGLEDRNSPTKATKKGGKSMFSNPAKPGARREQGEIGKGHGCALSF